MNRKLATLISSLKREKVIVANASSLMILQLSQFLFPLIIMPYLIRTLGIGNYGILVFSQTMATYFVMITNYGFHLSAPREISFHRENIQKRNEIISSVFIIKTILLILSYVIMILLVNSIGQFKDNSLVFLTSMLLVVNEVIFPKWFFQGVEEMGKITLLNIIGRTISVIVMFFIVTEPEHIVRAAFVHTLGGLIAGVISIIILFNKYQYKFVPVKFKDLAKDLVEGWNLFVSQLSTVLFQNINVTLLGLLATPQAVGIYSSGEKVVRIVVSLVNPIGSAIFPNISKLINESREKAVIKLRKILKVGTLFFLFVSFYFLLVQI
ncbi:oligosaccharide flippase family protein [Paenibacillus sp. EPM92]|uniref:oligosaccharide flippase family protein n=1 Tax=Paenibacillus sp. EPM92 TaxID=1561195 RepID=UPI00191662F2|nr:oligosaccharide flippase family protein [Paenibacillus sp. EPM92]